MLSTIKETTATAQPLAPQPASQPPARQQPPAATLQPARLSKVEPPQLAIAKKPPIIVEVLARETTNAVVEDRKVMALPRGAVSFVIEPLVAVSTTKQSKAAGKTEQPKQVVTVDIKPEEKPISAEEICSGEHSFLENQDRRRGIVLKYIYEHKNREIRRSEAFKDEKKLKSWLKKQERWGRLYTRSDNELHYKPKFPKAESCLKTVQTTLFKYCLRDN